LPTGCCQENPTVCKQSVSQEDDKISDPKLRDMILFGLKCSRDRDWPWICRWSLGEVVRRPYLKNSATWGVGAAAIGEIEDHAFVVAVAFCKSSRRF
jgi:hypothetical protein